jgi:inosine/xanthosine triphosphate pyrophosphatase family protein
VGTGADVLIPGFVIAGAPRAVLVRAIGPTLAQFGVSDSLSAPVLTLYDSESKPIASNTGWTTAGNLEALQGATARLGAFALADNSADSALFVTLNPGAYTAQTSGANNTAGVALVEIYEDGTGFRPGSIPPGGRLVNAAVRAQVGTGANVLIPGLVVSEGAAKTVLIRAVGPGLTPFGVSGVLSQPVVALFAGSESFVTNSGWNSAANAAEIRATAARVGAFALAENSRDCAILVSLSPGPYTVQVSGANNTSGVALVEVYEVP